jgi:hypothetical protein
MVYLQLTQGERYVIGRMRASLKSLREIARCLGHPRSKDAQPFAKASGSPVAWRTHRSQCKLRGQGECTGLWLGWWLAASHELAENEEDRECCEQGQDNKGDGQRVLLPAKSNKAPCNAGGSQKTKQHSEDEQWFAFHSAHCTDAIFEIAQGL